MLYKSAAIIGLIKLFSLFVGILLLAVLSKVLSKEEYGYFLVVYSFVGISSILGQLGLAQYVVRSMVNASDSYALLSSVFKLVSLFSFVASIIILAIYPFSDRVPYFAAVFVILVILFSYENVTSECHRAVKDFVWASLTKTFLSTSILVAFVASTYLLGLHLGLDVILALYAFSLAMVVIVSWRVFLRRNTIHKTKSSDVTGYSSIIRGALPFLLISIVVSLNDRVDIWYVALGSGNEEVGILGTAQRLMRGVLFFGVIINSLLPPYVVGHIRESTFDQLAGISRRLLILGGSASLITLFLYLMYGEWLIVAMFGEGYSDVYSVGVVLGVSSVFYVISAVPMQILAMTKNSLMSFIMTCFLVVKILIYSLMENINSFDAAAVSAVVAFLQCAVIFGVVMAHMNIDLLPKSRDFRGLGCFVKKRI